MDCKYSEDNANIETELCEYLTCQMGSTCFCKTAGPFSELHDDGPALRLDNVLNTEHCELCQRPQGSSLFCVPTEDNKS